MATQLLHGAQLDPYLATCGLFTLKDPTPEPILAKVLANIKEEFAGYRAIMPALRRRVAEYLAAQCGFAEEEAQDTVARHLPRGDVPPLPCYDDIAINDMPDPEWQIEGMWQEGKLVTLYGPSGGGKSFLALDFAYCISTGTPWNGCAINKPGPVVYLCAESASGMKHRIAAWKALHGVPRDRRCDVQIIPASVDLTDPDCSGIADLLETIEAGVGEVPPALVIVDTLARNFAADENSASGMGLFVKQCDAIAQTFGATVMVVHHTGKKEDSLRGSTALYAAQDTVMSLHRKQGRGLQLKCEKQKESEPFKLTSLVLSPIEGTESCAITAPGKEAAQADWEELMSEKLIADLIALSTIAGGASNAEWCRKTGRKRNNNDFDRSRKELLRRKLVEGGGGRGVYYRITPLGWEVLDGHHGRSGAPAGVIPTAALVCDGSLPAHSHPESAVTNADTVTPVSLPVAPAGVPDSLTLTLPPFRGGVGSGDAIAPSAGRGVGNQLPAGGQPDCTLNFLNPFAGNTSATTREIRA